MALSPIAALAGDSALVLTEVGAIFLFLGLIAFAAVRLRISSVPFFLVAGLAFGKGGAFDLQLSGSYLDTTAQIGVLLLLLLLGLEYSASELGRSVRKQKSVGLVDLVLNGLPGALVAAWFGWGPAGIAAMAGITYASSTGIAAQLIRDSGAQRSEVAKRAVSVLVVEDLVLAPYLPIITTLVSGIGLLRGMVAVATAFGVITIVLLIGLSSENRFAAVLNSPDPRALLLTVFGAALVAAGGAELFGFSGAVAAFLVGLLLTGEVANVVRARLSPLRDLTSSVFFLLFGLTTDPRDIPGVLGWALALALIGTAGKFAVAWWISRDMTDPLAWRRVGSYLVARGEFSILIAGLVTATGIGAELQALTTTYVILTSVIGSLLVVSFQSRFVSGSKSRSEAG